MPMTLNNQLYPVVLNPLPANAVDRLIVLLYGLVKDVPLQLNYASRQNMLLFPGPSHRQATKL